MANAVASVWATDSDLDSRIESHEAKRRNARGLALLSLAFGTLGVIYGDIGTSPLYTWASVFPDGGPEDPNILLGAMSTIFWSLTSVVLVKYVFVMLLADDHGEGGLMVLYALICRATGVRSAAQSHETDAGLSRFTKKQSPVNSGLALKIKAALARSSALQTLLLLVVMVGCNMVLSDGVLTPAISVVSAMEGIEYQAGISKSTVVGMSIAVLVILFIAQSFGTHRVSSIFSPIMVIWFGGNAAIGVYNIVHHGPSIFRALSPHYMYYYWSGRASTAWTELGAVMLCITGAEALYADLGHFSRPAVQIGFSALVYPSLTLTYLGQAAMILSDPSTSSSAYWSSLPTPVYWPMVVVATLAAIIASQAMISGSFSIVRQAMALNCFPRMTVKHTSKDIAGQVYMPQVNYMLMLATVFVVAIFQTSARISTAYGFTVITVMLLDTTLLAILQLVSWGWHAVNVFIFWLVYTIILAAYWSSNAKKIPTGAWFSLAISAVLTIVSYTWYWGQTRKAKLTQTKKIQLNDLFEEQCDTDLDPNKQSSQSSAAAAWATVCRHSMNSVQETGAERPTALKLRPDLQRLRLAGTQLPVARVPGVGIYYSEHLSGCPLVMLRFLSHVPAIHEVVIFLTNRHVPVPHVLPTERLLIRKLRFKGFFHVVARYGYLDVADQGQEFVSLVMQEILEYLEPDVGGITDWRSLQDAEAAHATVEPHHLQHGNIQLVQMQLDQGDENGDNTVMSAASTGSRQTVNFALATPRSDHGRERDGNTPGAAPSANPWVQQPSVLRRMLNSKRDDDAQLSLPLPGKPRTAVLSALAQGRLHDVSASLPLPPRLARPPIYRLPAAGEHEAVDSEANFGAEAATLKGPAAHSLQQELQRELSQQQETTRMDGIPPMVVRLQTSVGRVSAAISTAESVSERELLTGAVVNGITYIIGRSYVKPAPGSSKIKAFWLGYVYQFILQNVQSTYASYRIPLDDLLELGVVFEI